MFRTSGFRSGGGISALQSGAGRTFKSGGYYTGMMATGDTTMALSASTEYAIRFEVGAVTAFDIIGVEVTTGAALNTVRLGVRYDNGFGYPGTLLVDAGTVDASGTGFVSAAAFAQTLAPGRWWLCAALGGGTGAAIRARTLDPFIAASSTATNNIGAYAQANAGALPASFSSTLISVVNSPKIIMRAA
jgi:hypothetical protein